MQSRVRLGWVKANGRFWRKAAVRRGGESLREDPRRCRLDRVSAQEPRPRHPRGMRSTDRGVGGFAGPAARQATQRLNGSS